MRIKGNAIFLMVLMAVMLFVIIISLQMGDFRAAFLPITFGVIIFVMAALVLRQEFWGKKKAIVTDDEESDEGKNKNVRSYLLAGAWIVGFIVAVYLVGFIISIALLTISYMKTHGSRWITAITSAVLMTVLIYFAFEVFLRVTLYRGLIYTLLGY